MGQFYINTFIMLISVALLVLLGISNLGDCNQAQDLQLQQLLHSNVELDRFWGGGKGGKGGKGKGGFGFGGKGGKGNSGFGGVSFGGKGGKGKGGFGGVSFGKGGKGKGKGKGGFGGFGGNNGGSGLIDTILNVAGIALTILASLLAAGVGTAVIAAIAPAALGLIGQLVTAGLASAGEVGNLLSALG